MTATTSSTSSGSIAERLKRARPSSERAIPVRRLRVEPAAMVDEGWIVADDPIFSHFLATLSAVFPTGEDFFVASVKRHRDQIGDDAVLRSQVKGFIGQEANHGREHRRLNERLAQLGYNTERADRMIGWLCDRIFSMRPKTLAIAATAAAEHYTGLLAEAVLDDDTTRQTLFSGPGVEELVSWHALEELEHKNVCFDVMERIGTRYPVRVAGFGLTTGMLLTYVLVEWGRSVVAIRSEITPEHRRRFRSNLRRQKLISPWFVGKSVLYLRPGFHPDDTDTDALVLDWRERLAATAN